MQMLRRKIGGFYITEHIGSGGMSQVYLGLDPRSKEKRAIKILAKRATSPAAAYARFQREIEIIRGLSHPHIVKILDSGSMEDCFYYMMDYMPGGNLSRRLARGKLRPAEAMPLFATICDAVSHAHEHGIVHRDLKPANILLTASGAPMVSDFGIAKILDTGCGSLTRSNEIMGTIAYLAPEQRINTKRVDRRADIYALGAILYEMFMGFPPLGKFPLPRELQPDFPAPVQALLERCLASRPVDRFSDAASLLAGIRQCHACTERAPATHTEERSAGLFEPDDTQDGRFESDRIEGWLQKLREGTTRERLAVTRDMVENINPGEAKAVLKLFAGEEEKVRWGLIRVLGELRIPGATPLIINELRNPYHRECAIEALGNIGAEEGFESIRRFVMDNPESAMIALLPLARTGRDRAITYLKNYLASDMAIMRQAAIKALAEIESPEALSTLVEHMGAEPDDRVRNALQQCILSLESNIRRSERNTTARLA
jgi:hypothetical protein